MQSGMSELDLIILSLRREDVRQDDIVDAFKDYVIHEKQSEDALEKVVGFHMEGSSTAKFDLFFSALDLTHRQALKTWLQDRLKTPWYYPSQRVTRETYDESAKAAALPAAAAFVLSGPVFLTGVVASLFHHGKAQIDHRVESNKRAQQLLDQLNKLENFQQQKLAEARALSSSEDSADEPDKKSEPGGVSLKM